MEVPESLDAPEVWGKVGARGTGSENWEAEKVEVEGTA